LGYAEISRVLGAYPNLLVMGDKRGIEHHRKPSNAVPEIGKKIRKVFEGDSPFSE